VLAGKVKLTRHAPDGREILVSLLGPSDQFEELSLLDPGPRTTTAVVVTDARLASLPRGALDDWIARRPAIAAQLLRVVARQLRRTNASVHDLIFMDTSGRLAKELLRLAAHFGIRHYDEIRILHDLTQTELAQLVAASRETVNKVLNNYANRGWIRLESKSIVILNPDRLAQRAQMSNPLPRSDGR
jgi:CRP-like cAMP-binding protein